MSNERDHVRRCFASSGMIILIISCNVRCAVIFKSCSVCMFEIREKNICEGPPRVRDATSFQKRLKLLQSEIGLTLTVMETVTPSVSPCF